MVLFTGAKHYKSELHGTFSSLCKDPHTSVRKTMSSGYHEVRKQSLMYGLKKNPNHSDIKDIILYSKDQNINRIAEAG